MEMEQLSLVCLRRTRAGVSQRTAYCGNDARAAKLHGVEATGAHLLKTAKGGDSHRCGEVKRNQNQRVDQPPTSIFVLCSFRSRCQDSPSKIRYRQTFTIRYLPTKFQFDVLSSSYRAIQPKHGTQPPFARRPRWQENICHAGLGPPLLALELGEN